MDEFLVLCVLCLLLLFGVGVLCGLMIACCAQNRITVVTNAGSGANAEDAEFFFFPRAGERMHRKRCSLIPKHAGKERLVKLCCECFPAGKTKVK